MVRRTINKGVATRLTDARADVREAFALFDKKGTGTIQREDLGDLLRALGQNPTQADVATLASRVPNASAFSLSWLCFKDPDEYAWGAVDFNSFNQILNRPGGYDPAGTVGQFPVYQRCGNVA